MVILLVKNAVTSGAPKCSPFSIVPVAAFQNLIYPGFQIHCIDFHIPMSDGIELENMSLKPFNFSFHFFSIVSIKTPSLILYSSSGYAFYANTFVH